MKCLNCGENLEEDALFCGECGAPVEELIKKRKPNFIRGILIELIVLSFLILSFVLLGKQQYSPEKVAKDQFLNQMKGDWDAVYDGLEIESTVFLTKEDFVRTMTNSRETSTVTNYSLVREKDTEFQTKVQVTYRTKGEFESQLEVLSLAKQGKRAILFFNKWKVNPQNYIAKDYMIIVPMGAKVVVDHIELSSKYQTDFLEEDAGLSDICDAYCIPALFRGVHHIKIEEDEMKTVSTSFDTDSNFYLMSMSLKDKLKDEITKMATDTMIELYENASRQAPYSEVAHLFKEDENGYFDSETFYQDACLQFDMREVSWIDRIDFDDVFVNVDYMANSQDKHISVAITYDYKVFYHSPSWYDTSYEKGTHTDYGSTHFIYTQDNGSWALDEIFSFDIYY